MRNLFFVGLVLILLFGCKKEDESPNGTSETYNYFPLAIGNWWVYENYNIDNIGNETLSAVLDSLYIDNDTIISGTQYYMLEGSTLTIGGAGTLKFLRDSSGFIVNEKGHKIIAQNNFTDTLYNESRIMNGVHYFDISGIMKTVDTDITVGAGVFEVIECEQKITIFAADAPNTGIRYHNNYYANNIGQIVGEGSWYSSGGYFESRLLRYNIE